MSWSNSWIGRRAGIKAAMARYAATLGGSTKEEFEAARPHLEALVDLNRRVGDDPIVQIDANGSAWSGGSQVSVTLQTIGVLVDEPAPAAAEEGSAR
jgi:hypothetical protein